MKKLLLILAVLANINTWASCDNVIGEMVEANFSFDSQELAIDVLSDYADAKHGELMEKVEINAISHGEAQELFDASLLIRQCANSLGMIKMSEL